MITGAKGFYGSYLTKILIDRGLEVVGVDARADRTTKKKERSEDPLTLIECDIRDAKRIRQIMDEQEPDVIVHLAARISIDESMEDPRLYFEVNSGGTFNIVDAIMKCESDALLIYSSSSEVYGNPCYVPMDENHPLNPRSIYAASKLAGEKYCQVLYEWYGLPVVIIRNFNTYGPGQPLRAYSAVIPTFIAKLLKGEKIVISGTGEQSRDFLYIEDAVRAYDRAIQVGRSIRGSIINIGTGKDTSVNDIAKLLIELTGTRANPEYGPPRAGEVARLVADISRAKKLLEWEPRVALRDGLSSMIAWMKGNM